MNKTNLLAAYLFLPVLFLFTLSGYSQTTEPWTARDLMEPAALAATLNNPGAQKPVIFNIGPMANIEGAITIGSTQSQSNLDKMTKELAKVPKDKTVVIYCGCCPFRNCPNIRPAFKLLKEKGYTKAKLLNLKQNLKVDWTDYGYPME